MDPLPQRYLTDDQPGIGGRIKVRPDDFLVDEIPLYEPVDAGEHLYLRIQKCRVSHGELLSCVRRHFGVSAAAIGYAGMKDKHAISSQTISVHLPRDPPSVEIPHDRITVQWATRHRNKLRRGHLRGNRFCLRIRDVEPHAAPAALRIMRTLERDGVPAYFGAQRFGYRNNNHRLGAALLRGDWPEMLDELLGPNGSPFPDYQLERRLDFAAGRLRAAADAWTTADRAERIAAKALARGSNEKDAIAAIGRTTLNFWASACVSAVFNRRLDERIGAGIMKDLLEGDLAWKHDSRAVFPVTAETLADPALADRVRRLEVSPSGPLWGKGMIEAQRDVAEGDARSLTDVGLDRSSLLSSRYCPAGSRRPFRTPLRNVDVEGGSDEHGGYVRLSFDLDRGMYATVVAREVMKNADT